jgi:hypothetical protein
MVKGEKKSKFCCSTERPAGAAILTFPRQAKAGEDPRGRGAEGGGGVGARAAARLREGLRVEGAAAWVGAARDVPSLVCRVRGKLSQPSRPWIPGCST